MSNAEYTQFHRIRMTGPMYPTELVVRTLLGRYPGLELSREYAGRRLLDLGFGDGRNLPLFAHVGAEIYGVEPDPEVCAMVGERAASKGIPCTLVPGSNASIPFEDGFFDYVVACHSVYYVRDGDDFEANIREVARVMRPGAYLIASLPALDNFILDKAEALDRGHYRIAADPYGLRNGAIFRAFADEGEIRQSFAPWFEGFSFGSFRDDWYGIFVSGFIVVCKKKGDKMNEERD